MSEMDRFEAWWDEKGINSVLLRSMALTAWMARAELKDPTPPANQPDPDEWVVQDRVPVRVGDSAWWVNAVYSLPSSPEQMQVVDIADEEFQKGLRHGSKHPRVSNTTLYVMCRRRDLPPVEEPEQWPKYWTTFNTDTYAFVKQISQDDCQCVFKNGTHGPVVGFNHDQAKDRQPLTEAKAMALLEKPEPQPAKTRVRLWMRCDSGQFGSAVVASTFEKSGDWQEIHHDAEGFYVEQQ